jgi:hypothetical protein
MMETIPFSKTSVLTTATQRNIPEYGILHTHRCENFKSYFVKTTLCSNIALLTSAICLKISELSGRRLRLSEIVVHAVISRDVINELSVLCGAEEDEDS